MIWQELNATWQKHQELGTAIVFTVDPYRSAVGGADRFCDPKAKPEPPCVLFLGASPPSEPLEDSPLILRRNPATLVPHAHLRPKVVDTYFDFDGIARTIGNRVGYHVMKHLFQALAITDEPRMRRKAKRKRRPSKFERSFEAFADIEDNRDQIDIGCF